jgi:zinc protease
MVASIGVPRATPDYAPILVMNEVLGGLFSSRINLNLREEHGYTYGARSQFVFRRSAGPFVVATGVRTDVTGPAVAEIFNEIREIRQDGVTAEELTLARDSIVLSLPAQFETSSRVTSTMSNLYTYDLGLDYYARLPDRLSAVTAERAKAMAEQYVVPEGLIVIAVGDRARIATGLQALGLGAVEVRDADGMLIAP